MPLVGSREHAERAERRCYIFVAVDVRGRRVVLDGRVLIVDIGGVPARKPGVHGRQRAGSRAAMGNRSGLQRALAFERGQRQAAAAEVSSLAETQNLPETRRTTGRVVFMTSRRYPSRRARRVWRGVRSRRADAHQRHRHESPAQDEQRTRNSGKLKHQKDKRARERLSQCHRLSRDAI